MFLRSNLARAISRGLPRAGQQQQQHFQGVNRTTQMSRFFLAQQQQQQPPAQGVAMGVFILGGLGSMLGLTILIQKSGIANSRFYNFFEEEVIEKRFLRKISETGKPQMRARQEKAKKAEEEKARALGEDAGENGKAM